MSLCLLKTLEHQYDVFENIITQNKSRENRLFRLTQPT